MISPISNSCVYVVLTETILLETRVNLLADFYEISPAKIDHFNRLICFFFNKTLFHIWGDNVQSVSESPVIFAETLLVGKI